MTPKERAAIEQSIAVLTDEMSKLDHLHKPANVAEWAKLYEAREALLRLLGDDP